MPGIIMSFDPDGSVEFTRNKNLDAFFGGAGNMQRVTDIQKHPDKPWYCITWLMGPFARRIRKDHNRVYHRMVFGGDLIPQACSVDGQSGTIWFFSYELAVQYEIECLNKMRADGVTFGKDGVGIYFDEKQTRL